MKEDCFGLTLSTLIQLSTIPSIRITKLNRDKKASDFQIFASRSSILVGFGQENALIFRVMTAPTQVHCHGIRRHPQRCSQHRRLHQPSLPCVLGGGKHFHRLVAEKEQLDQIQTFSTLIFVATLNVTDVRHLIFSFGKMQIRPVQELEFSLLFHGSETFHGHRSGNCKSSSGKYARSNATSLPLVQYIRSAAMHSHSPAIN